MNYEIQIFDRELYETDADTPYLSVFIETKILEEKLEKIVEKIQEIYDEIYMSFDETEDALDWIKEKLKEKIPDVKFMEFITIRA